jgi:hypothetical protein
MYQDSGESQLTTAALSENEYAMKSSVNQRMIALISPEFYRTAPLDFRIAFLLP